jgi:tetratricopeptide (TPR) repeat protein
MGQLRKSVELMEKAIEIDPEFAMAYRSIGITYDDLGYDSRAKEYTQKAFELSNRVSLRERYQIQGDYYWEKEETYDKAIEAYNKLLELYPTDTDANINLGSIYRDAEDWDKALERFEVLRDAGDRSMWTYLNLAAVAMARESFAEAEEALQYYFNNIGEAVRLRYIMVRNYVLQGKLDSALGEINKVIDLNPDDFSGHIGRGDIYLLQGDLSEAEKEYLKSFESKESRMHYLGFGCLLDLSLMQGKFQKAREYAEQRIAWAEENEEMQSKAASHIRLGFIHSLSGNYEKTMGEVDKAWQIAVSSDLTNYQRSNYYSRANYLIDMGSLDKAQEAIDEYRTKIEMGIHKTRIRSYYILRGKLELAKGNFSGAIEYLENAVSLYAYGPLNTPAFVLDILGSAQYKAKDLKKAVDVYEKITKLTSGRLAGGHLYAKAFYMLGKIHEELGENDIAIENYEKFLELWKDADPGLPEVDDARSRLSKLRD